MGIGIPLAPADFTAEWVDAALRSAGHLGHDARVTSVTTSSLGEGFGLLGSLARLHIGYEGTAGPATLVAKFPSVAEANRTIARQYLIYEREGRFYRDIAHTIATALPQVLYADVEPEIHDAVVLLADMGDREVGNQLVSATVAQAEQALDEILGLHAAWWGKADAPEIAWVPYLRDPLWVQVAETLKTTWPTFQAQMGHLLDDGRRRSCELLCANVASIAERLSRPPATLLHGDFRMDNLFFGSKPEHEPLVLADWQLMSRGRGIYDVAYFLCQNMEPEDRRRTEMDLLRRYHDGLRASGVSDYSFDELLNDYRLAVVWDQMYGITAGGGLDLGNERGVALATAMASRCFAAVEDLEAWRAV